MKTARTIAATSTTTQRAMTFMWASWGLFGIAYLITHWAL
jgi:hypothetical protein